MSYLSAADFTEALCKEVAALAPGERRLVAIAGAPGSGKSTLAEHVVEAVNRALPRTPPAAAILPMDGYHYDDELLDALGRRARKGAPDTFDVGGLRAMLARLAANAEDAIAVPRFDRDIEIARAGARLIHRETPLVVVEGNYLLLDTAPWDTLRDAFDRTAMVMVDEATLRRRLTARWTGYALAPDEIARKVDSNDLPNGRMVIAESRAADINIDGRDD